MLFARTAEDRAKIDLKLHFMRKTLNEVVRAMLLGKEDKFDLRRSSSYMLYEL